jgi:RNA-binding protein
MSSEPRLSELKSRAQLLKPVLRLGKAGVTPEFLAALEEQLNLRQILKIRFEGFKEERKTLSKEIAAQTNSLLVQQVGHTAVYYRRSEAGR